jgi:hypothetical protein
MSEVAQLLSAIASVGTLGIALAVFFQGRSTHKLVNSQSETLLKVARANGFDAGRTEGRLGRLENPAPPPKGPA